MHRYPLSQSELIRTARGGRSQAEFSRLVGCDRSCLSRYESESLGAPPHVISQCLKIVASLQSASDEPTQTFDKALSLVRDAVAELELLQAVAKPEVRRR